MTDYPKEDKAMTMCGRMRTEDVLEKAAERANEEKTALEILRRVIPWETLTNEEEQTLWSYFVSTRRH